MFAHLVQDEHWLANDSLPSLKILPDNPGLIDNLLLCVI